MAKLTENDAPRWMAVKDGLDHGPFTARELIKSIVDGDILDSHGLLNMTTGERKPLGEWKDFHGFVEQYKLRKADADHAVALEKSTRIERTSNAAKFVIFGGSLALFLLAGGGYLMSRRAAERRAAQHDVDVAAMFESGRVKISGTAGILQPLPRRSGGGGGPKRSSGGNSGFTSYEDAMNQAMELGDATKGGGERQLRTADIEAVMNRKLNTLFGCVSQELRGGGRLGTVQIDMAILGSGQVAGASVNAGSASFKKCMATKMRQICVPVVPGAAYGRALFVRRELSAPCGPRNDSQRWPRAAWSSPRATSRCAPTSASSRQTGLWSPSTARRLRPRRCPRAEPTIATGSRSQTPPARAH